MGEINHHKKAGSALTRRVYKALGIFTGTQSLSILCSVIRTKLVALWIGASGVGLFGLYNAAIEMLSQLTQLGLRTSSVRDIAASPEESARRRGIVALVRRWSLILGAGGVLLTLIVSPLLAIITFSEAGKWPTFALLSVVMLLNSVTSGEQAVMQGEGHLRPLAKSSLWATLGALLVSVPILWFWRIEAVIPVLIIYSLAMTVASVIYGRRSSPVGGTAEHLPLKSGGAFLRLGTFLTISGFSLWLVSYLLISWLRHAGGDQLAGYYQAGYTLVVRYVSVLFAAIAMEFYPRLSTVAESPSRIRVYLTHEIISIFRIGAPIAVLFIVFAPWLVRLLYSEEFLVIVPYVTVAVTGVVFRAVSWCVSYVIVARADGRTFMAVEIASSLLYLGITILFYKLWGIIGFGFAFTLWYLIYLAAVTVICRWRYNVVPGRAAWIWAAGSAVITAGVSAIVLF